VKKIGKQKEKGEKKKICEKEWKNKGKGRKETEKQKKN